MVSYKTYVDGKCVKMLQYGTIGTFFSNNRRPPKKRASSIIIFLNKVKIIAQTEKLLINLNNLDLTIVILLKIDDLIYFILTFVLLTIKNLFYYVV